MSTIHLDHPAPPPTLNNLDPHQRTRLLRSARKLESLLGTTPYLLESPSTSSRLRTGSRAFTSTSSNAKWAHHRERRTLQDNHSPSSRSSKRDTDRSDSLAKRAHARVSSDKSAFELVPDKSPKLDPPSHNEKRSRLSKKDSLNKGSQGKPVSAQGIKSRDKTLDNKESHSMPISRPLVLFSIPVPPSDEQSSPHDGHTIASHPSASSSTSRSPSFAKSSSLYSTSSLSPPTFATNPDGQTLALPSTPTTPGLLTPLTPLSPTFHSNQSDSSEREKERERDARRKKLAKLARTLGENVPPELVFHTTIVNLEKDPDIHAKNFAPPSKPSKPTTRSGNGSESQHQSKSVQIIPVPRGPSSLNHKQKSVPASAPPIVIIGPPPTPDARRKRNAPPSPQTQNPQTEAHPSTELIIPPEPSTPAPLPPWILVEKYQLERQKAREMLRKSRLSSTPALGNAATETRTHRPRSLSLGSGIDLLGKYWAREVEVGDGNPRSGGSGSGGRVDGREWTGEAQPSPTLATEEGPSAVSIINNPSPYQTQFPSRPSTTTQHHTVHRTHRHAYSTPSPREPYFGSPHGNSKSPAISSPMSNLFIPLLRKSSKSKAKTILYTKAGVERSHSVKSKTSSGVEVEVMTSVESDEGAGHRGLGRTRSGTPRPLNGSRNSGLLLPLPECGRRREREWSGAWNRTDMGEVVKGLRELKGR